jgi:hypothetical protein
VAGLDVDAHEESKDKHLVSQVMIASGQLLAYLEAQTGLSGIASAGKSHYQVQTAPNIELNMGDVVGGQVDRVMDMINDAMRHIPRRPPQAPRPPEPPDPHGGMPGIPGMPGMGRPPRGERGGRRGREFFWQSDEDDEDDEA